MEDNRQKLELLRELDQNPADRRKLEILRQLDSGDKPQPSIADDIYSATSGINTGIAEVLGAPVDLANLALGIVGLDSENPIGGSKNIKNTMAGTGMVYANEDGSPTPVKELPSPKIGRIGQEVGAGAGAMLPFASYGRYAQGSGGAFKPVIDFFRNRPATFTAAETGSAATAGVGAVIANEVVPDNPFVEFIGQLVGGVASPFGMTVEGGRAPFRAIRNTFKTLFTKKGAESVAADIVQSRSRDPKKARGALNRFSGTKGESLTSGQAAGDAELISLERSIAKLDDEFAAQLDDALTDTNAANMAELNSLRGDGNIESTKQFFEQRVDYLKYLMQERSRVALERAEQKLARLTPEQTRENANKIVKREIEGALSDARTQENQLWRSVDNSAVVDISDGTKSTVLNALASRTKADDPDDIPRFITSLFGKKGSLGETPTVGELQTARSRILREITAERAKDAPNRNKIRILSDISDSILDDIGGSVTGDDYQTAIAFSRELNNKFTKGTVGDLLGFERTGEASVVDSLALETTVGTGKQRGAAAVDDLRKAAGDAVDPATKDFLRDQFLRKTTRTGKFNPNTAKGFITDNEELLARFPGLKKEFVEAINSQDAAETIIKKMGGREKSLSDVRKAKAAIITNSKDGLEIKNILNSRNPGESMRSLVRSTAKDKTGEALNGLRAGVIDEIFNAGKSKSVRDTAGNPVLSGNAMGDFINKHSKAILKSGLLTKDQESRLMKIVDTAKRLELRASRGQNVQQMQQETQSALLDLVSRVVGANIGGAGAVGSATGSPLVAAGAGATFARRLVAKIPLARVEEVLEQAVFDRQLMADLLAKPKTQQQALELERRLNGYLANIIPEFEEDQ